MSIELTNFSKRYEQAVTNIKAIKASNQRLQQSMAQDLARESELVGAARKKVAEWVVDMESQYLDPQTSRRVQIVKQQLNMEVKKHEELMAQTRSQKYGNSDKVQISEGEEEGGDGFKDLLFDHEHQSRIAKQRTKQLLHAQNKIETINRITQSTRDLTFKQGQVLDLIDDNISASLANTQQTQSYLQQAIKQQKKGQKKYIWLIGIAVAVVALVLIFIFLA